VREVFLSAGEDGGVLLAGNQTFAAKACQRPLGSGVLRVIAHTVAVSIAFDLIDLGNNVEGRWFVAGRLILFDHAQALTLYPT